MFVLLEIYGSRSSYDYIQINIGHHLYREKGYVLCNIGLIAMKHTLPLIE
jgi:hypothetical protein